MISRPIPSSMNSGAIGRTERGVARLLARRSISNSAEIAYYVCYGPRRSTIADLAWIGGARWRIEECFQQAKNEAGLDRYQVRSWRAWYAHITLSMLALAWLAGSKSVAIKGEPATTIKT